MEKFLKKYINVHSPGYVIDIYNNGKFNEVIYGNREVIPNEIPCNSNTLYDIASLTKTYTAVLIYIAYEENKIDIYDLVSNVDNRFTKLNNVRVIDLLSHNQEIWTDGYLGSAKGREEFYRILFSATVKSNIPTYVDSHYIILSTLLEKIYNKSYENILQEKILDKLGLVMTTINPKGDNIASNNYENNNDAIVDYIFPGLIHDTKGRKAKELGIITGHASIFTTGYELFLFLKSFLDYSLLKKETIELMLKHDDRNKMNKDILCKVVNYEDINKAYKKALKIDKDIKLVKTYNFMGTRYHNLIDDLNDVPRMCSENTIVFSGFTGPTFLIDFDNNIIIVIMCNVIHNTNIKRTERKKLLINILEKICKDIYL